MSESVEFLKGYGSLVPILATCVIFIVLKISRKPRHALPLPPGPKGLPFLGNLLENASSQPWILYREWGQQYGDMIFLRYPMNSNTLILNSAKAAFDLLEKKSGVYSDRPVSVMYELMEWDFDFGLMPYSSRWRDHRRTFHQYFHSRVVDRYLPIQVSEARVFLRRSLDSTSEQLQQSVRLIFTAIILRIVYDKSITDMDDPFVIVAQEALAGLSVAGIPGSFWIEYFPFLKDWLPSWVPGMRFRTFAKEYQKKVEEMKGKPFAEVRERVDGGAEVECMAASLLKTLPEDTKSHDYLAKEELAINSAGVAYAGAADTTTSSIQSFLIAAASYPSLQLKAQLELDRVVGPSRLPSFEDYDSLVYIRAIAMESMRWMPVFPLGVPHRSTEDDVYEGYFIPRGTDVFPNQWAMLHDPKMYPNPEVFNPDRFIKDGAIDPSVLDPAKVAFGFGRRICPGRYLSDNSLFITIASILHVFNISPAKDENGNPRNLLEIPATTALISAPESVPCVLTPRSEAAVKLIRSSSP